MAFPTGWGRKVKITIPDANISGSNVNFPILLTKDNLTTEMVDAGANSALNGGGDVRFSEDAAGTVQLALEVVTFVTNASEPSRDVKIWVKMPTLNTGAARDVYAWYKKAGETQPAVTASFGRNAVWAGEEIVLHMGEDPSGTAPQIVDSTGNGNDGTLSGSMTSGDVIAGQVGDALDFDHTDDHLNLGTSAASLGITQQATFRCWFNASSLTSGDFRTLLSDYNSLKGFSLRSQNTNELEVYVYPNNHRVTQTITIATGEWHSAAAVLDGATLRLYYDGVQIGTATLNENIGSSASTIKVGDRGDLSTGVNNKMDGGLDEVRISSVVRSADWLLTEHNNQNSPSTFATAGTPEAVGGGTMLIMQSINHSAASDILTLTQIHNLGVNNVAHGLTSETVSLNAGPSLTTEDGQHGLTSDSLVLSQTHTLALENGVQGHTADNLSPTQVHALILTDSNHSLISDSLILVQTHPLNIVGGTHASASDGILLGQVQTLVIQNATHGLCSDMSGLFDPTAFTPNPSRTQVAERKNRTSSPESGDRVTQPTNNRTLRI